MGRMAWVLERDDLLAAGGLVSGCSGENGESAVALRGRATAGGGGSARVSERDEGAVLAVSRRRNRCWKICPGVI